MSKTSARHTNVTSKLQTITEDVGKAAVLTGCVAGLGSLCLYGILSRPEDAAIDQAVAWPAYARQRIQSTYLNYGYGLATTAATAYVMSKRPRAFQPLLRGLCTIPGCLGATALIFGAGVAVQMTPYNGGIGMKHVVWTGYSALLGVGMFPMVHFFGPIIPHALLLTGGVLAGLTAVAITAPSDKFLYMGGTLGMGFGALFVGNIASMLLGPAKFPIVNNLVMYGGVILFSGFILHYTQGLIQRAKVTPKELDYRPPGGQVARPNYDPINNAIGLYIHTLNLFQAIVRILAFSGGKRK